MPKQLYIDYECHDSYPLNEIPAEQWMEAISMVFMFEWLLPKIDSPPIRKIRFRIVAAEKLFPTHEVLDNVAICDLELLPSEFKELAMASLKAALVDRILLSCLGLCRRFGWEISPFTDTADRLVKSDFHLEGVYGKALQSRNRKRVATIEWVLKSSVDVFVRIVEQGAEKHVRLVSLPARPALIQETLGSMKWHGDDTLTVYHKNRRDYWLLDLNEASLKFVYPRAESGDPNGQYELGMMYLNGHLVARNLEMATCWLRRAEKSGSKHARQTLLRNDLLADKTS